MRRWGLVLLAAVWLLGVTAMGADPKAPLKYSAAELELAEGLMKAMGMPKQFDDMITLMLDAQAKANPVMLSYRSVMEQFFRKHMSYEALKGDLAVIYAETFNAQELKELTALFSSPIGQKFVANSTELSRRGMELGQTRVQQNMAELIQMIQAEQKKQSAPAAQK